MQLNSLSLCFLAHGFHRIDVKPPRDKISQTCKAGLNRKGETSYARQDGPPVGLSSPGQNCLVMQGRVEPVGRRANVPQKILIICKTSCTGVTACK